MKQVNFSVKCTAKGCGKKHGMTGYKEVKVGKSIVLYCEWCKDVSRFKIVKIEN